MNLTGVPCDENDWTRFLLYLGLGQQHSCKLGSAPGQSDHVLVKSIVETIFAVVVASPDFNASEIGAVIFKDIFELQGLSIILVGTTNLLKVNDGAAISTTVLEGLSEWDQRDQRDN